MQRRRVREVVAVRVREISVIIIVVCVVRAGVSGKECSGQWVVVSGAEVVEAEVGVVLFAAIEVVVGSRSFFRERVPGCVVLVRVCADGRSPFHFIPAYELARRRAIADAIRQVRGQIPDGSNAERLRYRSPERAGY